MMQRFCVVFHPHLYALRTRPFLVPGFFRVFFRDLHVFAKTGGKLDDFAKVFVADGSDGSDLKKAIIGEFKLDTAPHRVRLLREVEGTFTLLDSCEKLSEQGVKDDSKVIVDVMAPELAPPPTSFPLREFLTMDTDPSAAPLLEFSGAF